MMIKLAIKLQRLLDYTRCLDFLAPLAIRLYLVPIFWMAGTQKLMHIQDTIAWFGNPDGGLGFAYPTLMAYLASFTETIGAICLLTGFAVRWIAIPMMVVMVVAAFSVHWENGWLAIAHESSEAAARLAGFLEWLEMHFPQRYSHITELGRPVALNNGVEFAVTYFIMFLTLFFIGAGRFFSMDYWLSRWTKYKN